MKTTPEMRVQIAKDVIAQVHAEQYKPTSGTYFTGKPTANDRHYRYDIPITKENVNDIGTCQVCAIGAAILSGIRLFNHVRFGVKENENDTAIYSAYKAVYNFFPQDQALAMEDAFEQGAFEFGKYNNYNERLVAIFQNIIDNDGEFIPRQTIAIS